MICSCTEETNRRAGRQANLSSLDRHSTGCNNIRVGAHTITSCFTIAYPTTPSRATHTMPNLMIPILGVLLLVLGAALIGTSTPVFHTQSFQGSALDGLYNGHTFSSVWEVYVIAPGATYDSLKAILAAGCVGIAAGVVVIISFFAYHKQIGRSIPAAVSRLIGKRARRAL